MSSIWGLFLLGRPQINLLASPSITLSSYGQVQQAGTHGETECCRPLAESLWSLRIIICLDRRDFSSIMTNLSTLHVENGHGLQGLAGGVWLVRPSFHRSQLGTPQKAPKGQAPGELATNRHVACFGY